MLFCPVSLHHLFLLIYVSYQQIRTQITSLHALCFDGFTEIVQVYQIIFYRRIIITIIKVACGNGRD